MPAKPSRKRAEPRASRPHMPGYGLPKSKKGLLPWKWAAARLSKSRQYWVVTVRPNRAPHMMLVWGLWWEDAFYFSTGSTSRKARNLSKNPKCVIASEDSEQAVILEGMAKPLRDRAKIREFLRFYGRKYKWDMSAMQDDMLALKEPVFVVHPKKAFGLVEKTFATSATRWRF
jgi:nitroimidazol reductase NimA-like FMN-containing flavoprotein (pyridoxamine 5'-phosphate oxidase superfamily)